MIFTKSKKLGEVRLGEFLEFNFVGKEKSSLEDDDSW